MAMNDFGIRVGTTLDSSNIIKTFNEVKSKIEKQRLNVHFNIETKSISDFNSQLKKIKINLSDSQLSKYNQIISDVSRSYKDTTVSAEDFGKTTRTIKTKIDNLNPSFNLTNQKLRELAKNIEGIDIPVKKTSESINKWRDSNGHIITQTRTWDNELGALITKIETYQNELGQTITKTTIFNDWMEKISESTKVVDDRISKEEADLKELAKIEQKASEAAEKEAKSIREAGEAIDKMALTSEQASLHTQTLGEKITTAAGKVALFKVSTTIVMGFYNAVSDARDRVVEYDKSLTELKKVWDDAYGSLDNLSQKLSEIGKETANTLTNMTDIATGIVKAGYSNEEDIAIMSEYVAKLQNTADEELTAAEATSILVSQLKAYHLEAEEASKVTDILNAVSAQQAVSSGDLSKALTVGSASMATYGNTIEQTTALITAGTTVMQNRSQQVSRGLNTIAARISKNEALLNQYGVALYDANGNLRSTYDVLLDLSKAWETMTTAEQLSVGQTLSGINQYRVFSAVMSQMSVAQEAYQQALESTGYTEQQNAVYMQSLQA